MKKILISLIAILLVTGCSFSLNDAENKEDNTLEEKVEFAEYKVGDKVQVKLNNNLTEIFYVLRDTDKTEENIILFAEKNIGYSAFNNDYSEGNDFEGSLIQTKLKSLTAEWTNINDVRLITVDEIKSTGLTTVQQCGPTENDKCDVINNDSWLLYSGELYWTMTKVNDFNGVANNKTRYVYYVDSYGTITSHIVGYEPGSDNNKYGTAFTNFGIRPVIEISKEYVTK